MRLRILSVVIPLLALFLPACVQVRFAGGGSLPGFDDVGKATVSFSGENCGLDYNPVDGEYDVRGRLTLTDKTAGPWAESGGVKLTGRFEKLMDCAPLFAWFVLDACDGWGWGDPTEEQLAELEDVCSACLEAELYSTPTSIFGGRFTYTSNSKDFPEGGVGYVCFAGTVGRGPQADPNWARILIDDGGFGGYTTQGLLQGNVNTINCPAPKY